MSTAAKPAIKTEFGDTYEVYDNISAEFVPFIVLAGVTAAMLALFTGVMAYRMPRRDIVTMAAVIAGVAGLGLCLAILWRRKLAAPREPRMVMTGQSVTVRLGFGRTEETAWRDVASLDLEFHIGSHGASYTLLVLFLKDDPKGRAARRYTVSGKTASPKEILNAARFYLEKGRAREEGKP